MESVFDRFTDSFEVDIPEYLDMSNDFQSALMRVWKEDVDRGLQSVIEQAEQQDNEHKSRSAQVKTNLSVSYTSCG